MEVFHVSTIFIFNFFTKQLLIKNSTDGNLIIADIANTEFITKRKLLENEHVLVKCIKNWRNVIYYGALLKKSKKLPKHGRTFRFRVLGSWLSRQSQRSPLRLEIFQNFQKRDLPFSYAGALRGWLPRIAIYRYIHTKRSKYSGCWFAWELRSRVRCGRDNL